MKFLVGFTHLTSARDPCEFVVKANRRGVNHDRIRGHNIDLLLTCESLDAQQKGRFFFGKHKDGSFVPYHKLRAFGRRYLSALEHQLVVGAALHC